MRTGKSTPGPWQIVEGFRSGAPRGIKSITRNVNVVNFNGISRACSDEGEANALLIVAAPTMLEALIEFYIWLGAKNITNYPIDKIESIIKSATGQTIDEIMSDAATGREG
jgi:hypothetical protein